MVNSKKFRTSKGFNEPSLFELLKSEGIKVTHKALNITRFLHLEKKITADLKIVLKVKPQISNFTDTKIFRDLP